MVPMAAKRKKKTDSSLIPLVSVLILCLVIVISALAFRQRQIRYREQALYNKLTQIRELVTNRQVYRSVFYSRIKDNFIQERSFLFTADFHVSAGVDLARGFSLRTDGNSAVLQLPAAGILSIDADDTSIEEVFVKERFSSVTTGDYLPLLGEEKENIRRTAEESGLERDAERRAEMIFRGMLKMAGYDRITVSFRREVL